MSISDDMARDIQLTQVEINKNDYSIQIADTDDDYPFSSSEELVENLPDNTPDTLCLVTLSTSLTDENPLC